METILEFLKNKELNLFILDLHETTPDSAFILYKILELPGIWCSASALKKPRENLSTRFDETEEGKGKFEFLFSNKLYLLLSFAYFMLSLRYLFMLGKEYEYYFITGFLGYLFLSSFRLLLLRRRTKK